MKKKNSEGEITPEMIAETVKLSLKRTGESYTPLLSFRNFNRLEFMIQNNFLPKNGQYCEVSVQYYWHDFEYKHKELARKYMATEDDK